MREPGDSGGRRQRSRCVSLWTIPSPLSDSANHMGSVGCSWDAARSQWTRRPRARCQGDNEHAAEMFEDALSAYRAFGMPTYAAEAERLQRQAQG